MTESKQQIAVIYNRFNLEAVLAAAALAGINTVMEEVTMYGSDQAIMKPYDRYVWIDVTPQRGAGSFFEKTFHHGDRAEGTIGRVVGNMRAKEENGIYTRNGVSHVFITKGRLRSDQTQCTLFEVVTLQAASVNANVVEAIGRIIDRFNNKTIGDQHSPMIHPSFALSTLDEESEAWAKKAINRRRMYCRASEVTWLWSLYREATTAILLQSKFDYMKFFRIMSEVVAVGISEIDESGELPYCYSLDYCQTVEAYTEYREMLKHILKKDFYTAWVSVGKTRQAIAFSSINCTDYIWAKHMFTMSHRYYVNVVGGMRGHVVDTNVPWPDQLKLNFAEWYGADSYK